jgi:hypothetical protein
VLIGLLVAVGVIAVIHAIRLERRVSILPSILQSATSAAENGQLAAAQADLARAGSDLTAVNSELYNSPDFSIIGELPVARQNLDAIRNAAGLGLQMISDGEEILQAATPLERRDGRLDVSLDGGRIPLAASEQVAAAITQVMTYLPASPDPPGGAFLIGKVRSLQRRIYQEAAAKRSQLESVSAALRLLDDIAGATGDRRYLIAVANSAEMRGSGGMILSYGVLTSHDGQLTLQHFGPIAELALSSPETTAQFPADFMKAFGDLDPTQDWRNVNLMSDFTVDAPVMEAMYTKATGNPVDGVIQIDPVGLAALLAGIGPVQTADLGVVSSANVVPLTLNKAYFLYPNRTSRQDYTGEVAQAAFARLTTGSFSGLRPLAKALVDAGKQRHVLMYSNDPTDESLVKALGFGGALPPPTAGFAQLTVQNIGANKLDYYLYSSLTVTGTRLGPYGSRVTATISLDNTAPAGQTSPVEVFGPYDPGEQAGEYLGLVTLYLPEGSYLQSSQPDASVTTYPTAGSQNSVATVTYTVAIPAGGSSQVSLQLDLPPTPSTTGQLVFVPSPRVIPTRYSGHLS